jgi:aminomethyltransferase
VVQVKAGDEVTVTDLEGLQACELVTAGIDGRIDAGLLGARANSKAEGLKAMLAAGGTTAKALARRGIDLGKAGSAFSAGSVSARSRSVIRDGLLIAAAGRVTPEVRHAADLNSSSRAAAGQQERAPLPEPWPINCDPHRSCCRPARVRPGLHPVIGGRTVMCGFSSASAQA